MAKAMFNGQVIAESDATVVVENNHYFPPDSIKREYFTDSDVKTVCPWKGEASYYDVTVDGKLADYAAWYYPAAKDKAKNIQGYLAFWRGVEVVA